MTTPTLSKKFLSKILRKQLEIYNTEHPNDAMSYEILFERARYFQIKHPVRYACLGYAFDKDIDKKLLDRIRISYKKKESNIHKKDPIQDPLNQAPTLFMPPDSDSDDFNDFSMYMNGDYSFEYELPEYDPQKEDNELDILYPDKFIVKDPNSLYYTLARVTHMDEQTLLEAFYAGEGLSIIEYDMQYIRDVLDYYLQKSNLTQKILSQEIHKKKFKKSNIGNMFQPDAIITFAQFTEITPFLNIPEHVLDACRYRLAQFHDAFATDSGYQTGQEDLYESLAEIGIYDDQIYLYKLFTYLGFSFQDYPIMPTKTGDIASYMSPEHVLSITTPTGIKSSITVDNYLNIIDKISDYAKELLENECTHANNNTQK